MKLVLLVFLVVFSLSSQAKEVSCENTSYYYVENTFSLDLEKMEAKYFDNDIDTLLKCSKGHEEVDPGVIFCKGDGAIARVKPSGETTVVDNPDQWIEFECQI